MYSLTKNFNNDKWIAKLPNLSDIFELLNKFNVIMQGKNRTIIDIG